jgi:TRAP-type mannitol/chloroaromatic compound transport system permease large subunit
MTELICFFSSLFFFLFLGVPIAVVLVLCAIALMALSGSWDAMTIPNSMMDAANNYPLMAIPFFVFAGEIMAAGGLSKRVVQLAQLLVGRVKGGLGYAAIVASVIFAGLMGSSVG